MLKAISSLQHRSHSQCLQHLSGRPACKKSMQPRRAGLQAQITDVGGGLQLKHLGGEEELQLLFAECYNPNGSYMGDGFITIKPGDTVVDVGANIGLFSLFASKEAGSSGAVIGIEPFPEAAQAARHNINSHLSWCHKGVIEAADHQCSSGGSSIGEGGAHCLQPGSRLVNAAPKRRGGQAKHARFPQDTVCTTESGGDRDQAAGSGYMGQAMPDSPLISFGRSLRGVQLLRPLSNLLEDLVVRSMLASRTVVSIPQITISGLMQGRNLKCIDLLKIDVERAELQVLDGINEKDWPSIRQVSMEVHNIKEPDGSTRVQLLEELLASKGLLTVLARQDERMVGTNLWMVYAKQ